MFCILYENRNFLLDLWEEVLAGERIYPFDELNLGIIDYYDGSTYSELPLLFIDDEEGLCGSAVMRPLESDKIDKDAIWRSEKNINAWILGDIRLHIKNIESELIYSSKIRALQMRFYKALKEACYKVMEVTSTDRVLIISANVKAHEALKKYGDFNFIKEYSSKTEIISILAKRQVSNIMRGNVIPFRIVS